MQIKEEHATEVRLVAGEEQPRRVPLDGPLERRHVSPLLMALLVLVFGFVLFQLIGSAALVALLLAAGVPSSGLLAATARIGEDHASLALVGNMIGLAAGLGLPAYLIARLHSSNPSGFLRLRPVAGAVLLLALIGLAGLTPFVQWAASVNQALPLPHFLEELQRAQEALLESALAESTNVWLNLLMLAITPAICEELFFRGYLQRQLERRLGAATGIVFSGLLFGLFHFRLSELGALTALGIFLAYLTWRTGSLWPAILVHFANNAFAVIVSATSPTKTEVDGAVETAQAFTMPWYFVVAGLIVFAIALAALQRWAAADATRSATVSTHPNETTP